MNNFYRGVQNISLGLLIAPVTGLAVSVNSPELPPMKVGASSYSLLASRPSVLDDSAYLSALETTLKCRLQELKDRGLIVRFEIFPIGDRYEAHILSSSVEAATDIIFAFENLPDLSPQKIELNIA
jgi:hypothetical protein